MEKTTFKEEAMVEPALVKEVIAVAPEEVQAHLQQGKVLFQAARYEEALEEFEAILKTAPGSIETRVWIRKTKEALANPEAEAIVEEEAASTEVVKPKECVWMKMGVISYRICTNEYECLSCEFNQMMQEEIAKEEHPELENALERFKKVPGNQRLCRYALKGCIPYRLCTQLFYCETCEFGQNMEDALKRKLDKLPARHEALRKKAAASIAKA